MTELLAQLEGLERGPAGNTSLAAAFSVARELNRDEILVVQETEYTGAGKHPSPQLTFARSQGVVVRRGHPAENKPGELIVIPDHPAQISAREIELNALKRSYLKKARAEKKSEPFHPVELKYLAAEINSTEHWVEDYFREER